MMKGFTSMQQTFKGLGLRPRAVKPQNPGAETATMQGLRLQLLIYQTPKFQCKKRHNAGAEASGFKTIKP